MSLPDRSEGAGTARAIPAPVAAAPAHRAIFDKAARFIDEGGDYARVKAAGLYPYFRPLTLAEGTVTLDAGNGEEAQASESIEAQLTGDPVTVGFNPTYLLDGLSAIGTPVAQLAFTQATKPAELTGATDLEADPQTNFRYILMPVRLHT